MPISVIAWPLPVTGLRTSTDKTRTKKHERKGGSFARKVKHRTSNTFYCRGLLCLHVMPRNGAATLRPHNGELIQHKAKRRREKGQDKGTWVPDDHFRERSQFSFTCSWKHPNQYTPRTELNLLLGQLPALLQEVPFIHSNIFKMSIMHQSMGGFLQLSGANKVLSPISELLRHERSGVTQFSST